MPPRRREGVGPEAHPLLDLVEDGPSAGMHGPVPHVQRSEARRPQQGLERREGSLADDPGNVARQRHVEPVVADGPGHVVLALGCERAGEGLQRERGAVGRSRADHGRGAAVGEQRGGDQHVGLAAALEVQGAELDGDDQDHGVGVGGAEGAGHAQRREGGVTPHEAQMEAFGRRREPEGLDHRQVGPGSGEAGARHRDDVRDVVGPEASSPRGLERPRAGKRRCAARAYTSLRRAVPGLRSSPLSGSRYRALRPSPTKSSTTL